MKIAFLASTFLPTIGGAEVLMHNLAIHLQQMGHDVHIITWWGNWLKVRGQLPYPVHPLLPRSHTNNDQIRLNTKGETRSWVSHQIGLYQHLYSFDVVNIHIAYPMGPLCASTLSRKRIPSVMTCHGGDLLYDESMGYGLRCNPVLGKALVESILACDLVTAHSWLMEKGYRDIGVPQESIMRIPNGVDVAGIERVEDPGTALRNAHGIPTDAPLLLTVGRHVNCKGFRFIPDILRALQDQGHDPWWVVVGAETEALQEIPGAEQLRGRLITLPTLSMNLSGNWRDRLSHLPPDPLVQWYKTADVYVHPAIMESFGNIVVEAMAAGLPLVVTDGTGSSDCVEKARCGLIAKSRDVNDIATKIQQMLINKPLRQEMAMRAREGAKEYDWPIIARKYAAVYEKAIAAKKVG